MNEKTSKDIRAKLAELEVQEIMKALEIEAEARLDFYAGKCLQARFKQFLSKGAMLDIAKECFQMAAIMESERANWLP